MSTFSQPYPVSVSPSDLIGPVCPGRQLRMVAVTTVNGSASAGGTSGSLGNETDAKLLAALRDWSDVVLVGSQTVKKEQYGPVAHGGVLAIISRSLGFTGEEGFFAGPTLILTPDSSLADPAFATRRETLIHAGATLVSTGSGSAKEIVAALNSRGCERISCEGGPSIYALLLAAGLVDVAHITLDPSVLAPVETPLLSPHPNSGPVVASLRLEMLAPTYDGTVFLRYRSRCTD